MEEVWLRLSRHIVCDRFRMGEQRSVGVLDHEAGGEEPRVVRGRLAGRGAGHGRGGRVEAALPLLGARRLRGGEPREVEAGVAVTRPLRLHLRRLGLVEASVGGWGGAGRRGRGLVHIGLHPPLVDPAPVVPAARRLLGLLAPLLPLVESLHRDVGPVVLGVRPRHQAVRRRRGRNRVV